MGQLKSNYTAHHFTNWGNLLLIPEVLHMSLEVKIDLLCIQMQTKYKTEKTLIRLDDNKPKQHSRPKGGRTSVHQLGIT